jgi:pimeloyl-ACP methyl ester carboxylesterase
MNRRARLTCVAGTALAVSAGVVRRYRSDLSEANRRLDSVDRAEISTEFGVLEYAERGKGAPVLVSHGIFHGCDGGLLAVRDVIDDRRVIVPSRFGYLGSTLPPDASSATQADAFVALLDRLALDRVDVIGISAGTGAAVQLAVRHPDRVGHLVISSGNLPGSPTATAPPGWATLFYNDPAMWTLETVGRRALHRLMGVPSGFPQNADQAAVIAEMVHSIFPLKPRRAGAVFDAFVSNPEVNTMALGSIEVPTLIVHAKDDPLASYDAAARAAARIPSAVLVTLESGGHLALGQSDRVRSEIASFLGTTGRSHPHA